MHYKKGKKKKEEEKTVLLHKDSQLVYPQAHEWDISHRQSERFYYKKKQLHIFFYLAVAFSIISKEEENLNPNNSSQILCPGTEVSFQALANY